MKRIQETYNMFMALISAIILNAIVIGVVLVLPVYFFVLPIIY